MAAQTLACGLLGLPPVNGVLPQAPMHSRALITLRAQNALAALRRKWRKLRPKAKPSGAVVVIPDPRALALILFEIQPSPKRLVNCCSSSRKCVLLMGVRCELDKGALFA